MLRLNAMHEAIKPLIYQHGIDMILDPQLKAMREFHDPAAARILRGA